MYYIYVLRSRTDGKLYIGFTDNLKKRYAEHQRGLVESTKTRRPFEMVYYEACLSEQKALSREKYFKSGYGRRFLKIRI